MNDPAMTPQPMRSARECAEVLVDRWKREGPLNTYNDIAAIISEKYRGLVEAGEQALIQYHASHANVISGFPIVATTACRDETCVLLRTELQKHLGGKIK